MPSPNSFKQVFNDIEYEIFYHYFSGSRGSSDSMGVPLEPDTEPEVELVRVVNLLTGIEVPWDKLEEHGLDDQEVYEAIWKEVDFQQRNP